MIISKFKLLEIRIFNCFQFFTKWIPFKIRNRRLYSILQKNKRFRNIHKGQACFILGNGPSLKDVDFSLLKNHFVFTVNQISRKKGFEELRTNYHFWADPNFFRIDKKQSEDLELLNVMKSLRTNDNKPTVFFPIEQLKFVEENGLDSLFDAAYFKSGFVFHEKFKKIDYCKMIPGFGTVVQWCISAAIYMGFSHIYLLGCDNTSLIANINAKLDQPVTEYGYSVSKNEQARIVKMMSNSTIYSYSKAYTNLLLDYMNFYSYCSKKGIEIINCTNKSAIDLIPHKNLQDVLEGFLDKN